MELPPIDIEHIKNRAIDALQFIAVVGVIFEVSNWAFDHRSRNLIWERAKGRSEVTGLNGRPLECSHIDHDRQSGYYQHPDNGLLLRDVEHLAYHIDFIGRARSIGLTEQGNDYAIEQIQKRVEEYNYNNAIEQFDSIDIVELSNIVQEKIITISRKSGLTNPYVEYAEV